MTLGHPQPVTIRVVAGSLPWEGSAGRSGRVVETTVAKGYLVIMGQPVKLSSALVREARMVASYSDRSIAGQIEHWAKLGRALDAVIRPPMALEAKRSTALLRKRLDEVGTPAGRARARKIITAGAYPLYEGAPDHPGFITRVDADGTRTLGRLVDRIFVPAKAH